ncbi:MAG TPA: DUF4230 domain-containing protein [Gemmatimonadales bacterium]|nr:DUF4230 domain-containing protein [Gemmatimonadales bacterium]
MARSTSRPKIAAIVVSLLLLAGALLLIGTAIHHIAPQARGILAPRGQTSISQSVVVEQMRAVAKLVSSETSVRDVVVYQNRRLGSTKRSLVVVTGKVLAGIDLDQGTQIDIDRETHQVRIGLPHARVLGVETTQLRTYDERNGLWNPFRPEDRDTIYQLARDQLTHSAAELGVTAHAEESARRMLAALIHPEGYTVQVTFGGKSANSADKTAEQRRN